MTEDGRASVISAESLIPRLTSFLPWLERTGPGAIPRPVSLSLEDDEALDVARSRVLGLLAERGLLPMHRALTVDIADWLEGRIRQAGFRRYLFGGGSMDPRHRRLAVEILEDLAL